MTLRTPVDPEVLTRVNNQILRTCTSLLSMPPRLMSVRLIIPDCTLRQSLDASGVLGSRQKLDWAILDDLPTQQASLDIIEVQHGVPFLSREARALAEERIREQLSPDTQKLLRFVC